MPLKLNRLFFICIKICSTLLCPSKRALLCRCLTASSSLRWWQDLFFIGVLVSLQSTNATDGRTPVIKYCDVNTLSAFYGCLKIVQRWYCVSAIKLNPFRRSCSCQTCQPRSNDKALAVIDIGKYSCHVISRSLVEWGAKHKAYNTIQNTTHLKRSTGILFQLLTWGRCRCSQLLLTSTRRLLVRYSNSDLST